MKRLVTIEEEGGDLTGGRKAGGTLGECNAAHFSVWDFLCSTWNFLALKKYYQV